MKNYDAWKAAYAPIQSEIDETREKINDLKSAMKEMEDVGEVDTDAYKALQTELEDTNKKLKDLKQQAKTVTEEFGNPISTDQYDALQREIVETEQKLKDLNSQSKKTEDALKNIGDSADNARNPLEKFTEVLSGQALMEAADQLSEVGDKIQEIGEKAMDTYSETQNAVTKVNAYFGETGEAAQESADLIKDVYGKGVGDSMDSVADAVITVKKNLNDLSDTDLSNLTQQALTLDELYGIDMNETLRGVNSLMEQFGLSAQQAMDYIVAGTQNGLDKTNELGDNLSEYAGKFAQAGYSAQEYFQLLDNGLQNGAYNLDKVNDAINEVTTRLADGTIGENLDMYSSKTRNLFQAWQDGSTTQKEVIDSIVADIANCTSQQDALNMAAQAFGTMAEDGNLKFITSLTSVGDTYDSVGGKAQQFLESSTTPMQEMESNIRRLQQTLEPLGEKLMEIANQILPPLISAIETISGWFSSLPEPIQNFILILGSLIAVFTALAPVISAVAMAVMLLNTSLLPIIAVIAGVAAAIAAIIAIVQNWGAITEWFGNLWDTVSSKCSEIWSGIKDFFVNIWNGIKDFFVNIANNIKQAAIDQFTAMKNTVTKIFETVKNVFSDIWNGIKDFVSNTVTNIKDTAVRVFNTMKDGISSVCGKIGDTVKNGFNTAIDFITSLPGKALQWGKDFIGGIIDGIKSMIGKVGDAVKSIADKITSFLHFSRPDEGPLREYEAWMPDFMEGLAKGIDANVYKVQDALEALSSGMGTTLQANTSSVMLQESTISRSILDLLGQYMPVLVSEQGMSIVLDDGTLVGKLMPKINQGLNQIKVNNGRGRTY